MTKRRLVAAVMCGALVGVGCGAAGEAEMDGAPAAGETDQGISLTGIKDFIDKAFGWYSTGKKILSLTGIIGDPQASGPDLAAKLGEVQQSIVKEIQAQRLNELADDVNNALTVFANTARMKPGDPALVREREYAVHETERLIGEFAGRVSRNEPLDGTYALAPAFTALVTNYIALLKMKGEIDPKFPVPWGTYNARLREAFLTNYKLVGSREEACAKTNSNPGNPRYCSRDTLVCGLKPLVVKDLYRESALYTQKFGNFEHKITGCRNSSLRNCSTVSCNVGQHKCYDGGREHTCESQTPSMRDTFMACLQQAREIADRNFSGDATVGAIRASQAGLQKVGGGESPRDEGNTTLPTQVDRLSIFGAQMLDPKTPRGMGCEERYSPVPQYSRWYVIQP